MAQLITVNSRWRGKQVLIEVTVTRVTRGERDRFQSDQGVGAVKLATEVRLDVPC
jgi:hypothetical protein